MLDDKILKFLKEQDGGYVSGEEMSDVFGISRTAIWKHIEKLREEGYTIDSSPHLGYRLVAIPDRLTEIELRWHLETDLVGRKIYSYNEVGSTNEVLSKLSMSGEEEGTVVVAEYQSNGRGRLGRQWVSPSYKGAYLSVLLRPNILPTESSFITLFSSISVAKTIREMVGISAFIKWPNDILVNGKKVCGILTEMSAEIDKVHFVIVGIGVNINTNREVLPEGASSLAIEKGNKVDRIEFVRLLLRNLDRYYKIFNEGKIEDIIDGYKKLSSVLYKNIKIEYNNKPITGYVIDVDRDGALILRLDSGLCEKVMVGDVVKVR